MLARVPAPCGTLRLAARPASAAARRAVAAPMRGRLVVSAKKDGKKKDKGGESGSDSNPAATAPAAAAAAHSNGGGEAKPAKSKGATRSFDPSKPCVPRPRWLRPAAARQVPAPVLPHAATRRRCAAL
jgi:hypothetical protein